MPITEFFFSQLRNAVNLYCLCLLGYIFNVMDECIVMAAGLASKNIFTSSFDEKLRAYQVKMLWGEGCFSDPLTIMRAYSRWTTCHHEQQFKRSGQSMADREAAWAKSNFIQLRAIKVEKTFALSYRQLRDSTVCNFAF